MHSVCTHLYGHACPVYTHVWACTACVRTRTGMPFSWGSPGCAVPLPIHSPCVASSRAEAHFEPGDCKSFPGAGTWPEQLCSERGPAVV